MAVISLLGFVVLVAGLVIVLWLVARLQPRPAAPSDPEIELLLVSARRRVGLALIVSAAVFLGSAVVSSALPQLLGLPMAVGAGAAATVGLLVYAASPPRSVPVAPSQPREVSLTRRTPLSSVPPVASVLFLILVLGLLGYLIFTGTTSSVDESGRFREISFRTATGSTTAGPYPGWFYAVPLLGMTVLSTIATFLALVRVGSVPALPRAALAAIDARWRRTTSYVLIMISIASIAFQTGGAAVFGGSATRSATFDGVDHGWIIVGWASLLGGILMLAASVVAVTLAGLAALSLRRLALAPTGDSEVSPSGVITTS